MNILRSLISDRRATAAAELALILPFLIGLGMGAAELGNYFLDEHRLVKAVRDGARYAARQDFSNFAGCTATPSDVGSTLAGQVKQLVRTGQVSGGTDQLANWSGATFSVQVSCDTTYGSQTMGGIYSIHNNGEAPVVIVTATVPYQPIALSSFGFNASGYSLYAQQQAPVAGI
jgi:TadE-like protein